MLTLIRQSFKPAIDFTVFFLKTSWHWVLIFHVLTFGLSEFFLNMAELDPMNSQLMILCKIGELLTALLFSLFLLMLLPARWAEWRRKLPLRPFGAVLRKYTGILVLESLRVFGKVLLWMLFFILPGFFQYIRLSLVPFIVMINEDYDKGRLDALKHSHDLIRGHDVGFFLLLVLVTLFDLAYEFSGMIPGIPGTLEMKLILSLLTLPLSLYSYSLLIEVYGKLEEQLSSRTK